MTVSKRDQQRAQAEEILGDQLQRQGFAKSLYFGQHRGERLPDYPEVTADTMALAERLRRYCDEHVDPQRIDREADIPRDVINGLGQIGVLGACLPKECGGLALSQVSYCRLLEVLGGHCASTALFVNAHHSIGPRAIVLFGTRQQKEKWLPKMATGEWISAFALTEPEAGSDAGNVQTQAVPAADCSGYVLNGEKRYITNGAIAQAFTVMARTPVAGNSESKITAFIVTPDMPGFELTEARMPKCGVRGTATSRLAFRNMFVPRENVLGQVGKGLKVALTVLDYGRTTFGASCTGAAKFCVKKAVEHANTRVQFGETLGTFELVKDKIAYMASAAFAMESATYQTAALIDAGEEDYMLETAMLKVFSTECLWRIINDTIQVFGGQAYFANEPYERMMRDARINMIGEGANDVLRAFIALVGMRDVGLYLEGILNAFKSPLANLGRLGSFAASRFSSLLLSPEVNVRSAELEEDAAKLGRLVGKFGAAVDKLLRTYQLEILDRQYQLGRAADAATELFVCGCVLNRLDHLLHEQSGGHHSGGHGHDDGQNRDAARKEALTTGRYYLNSAARRIRRSLADLWDNDDPQTTRFADWVLGARRS